MALARKQPELTQSPEEPTALERYWQIEIEIRESIEAILKKHGENWTSWRTIKRDAAEEMADTGRESVQIGQYTITLSRKAINMYPADGGIQIATKLKLSLHKG